MLPSSLNLFLKRIIDERVELSLILSYFPSFLIKSSFINYLEPNSHQLILKGLLYLFVGDRSDDFKLRKPTTFAY